MKQTSPKCNVPDQIWNRYPQIQCLGSDMKQISPKCNVLAQIWNRYPQNTMSRLRYETNTPKIHCPASDMKQISPKCNVPDEIWNRYLQNTMSRLRYETDTVMLLLERIRSKTTFILPSWLWLEKGDDTLVQKYETKKTRDKCRLDNHCEPKFGPGTSQEYQMLTLL